MYAHPALRQRRCLSGHCYVTCARTGFCWPQVTVSPNSKGRMAAQSSASAPCLRSSASACVGWQRQVHFTRLRCHCCCHLHACWLLRPSASAAASAALPGPRWPSCSPMLAPRTSCGAQASIPPSASCGRPAPLRPALAQPHVAHGMRRRAPVLVPTPSLPPDSPPARALPPQHAPPRGRIYGSGDAMSPSYDLAGHAYDEREI